MPDPPKKATQRPASSDVPREVVPMMRETAVEHVRTRVPPASPSTTAGEVRWSLIGREVDTATHVVIDCPTPVNPAFLPPHGSAFGRLGWRRAVPATPGTRPRPQRDAPRPGGDRRVTLAGLSQEDVGCAEMLLDELDAARPHGRTARPRRRRSTQRSCARSPPRVTPAGSARPTGAASLWPDKRINHPALQPGPPRPGCSSAVRPTAQSDERLPETPAQRHRGTARRTARWRRVRSPSPRPYFARSAAESEVCPT